jgi:hypothetical protein
MPAWVLRQSVNRYASGSMRERPTALYPKSETPEKKAQLL